MKTEKWDYAIEKGGFYFDRAKYLGVPAPSQKIVDTFLKEEKTNDDLTLIGKYHEKVMNAESNAAMSF